MYIYAMFRALAVLLTLCFVPCGFAQETKQPVRIAIVGLEHDHAWALLRRFVGRTDVELVGIVETDPALIARFAEKRKLPSDIFYKSLNELMARRHEPVHGTSRYEDAASEAASHGNACVS